MIAAGLGVGYLVRRGLGRRIGRGWNLGGSFRGWFRGRRKQSGIAFYHELLRLLRRKGYEKPAALTPREFLGRIPAAPSGPPASFETASLRTVAGELTDLYYRVRYADVPLSSDEAERVDGLLDALRGR